MRPKLILFLMCSAQSSKSTESSAQDVPFGFPMPTSGRGVAGGVAGTTTSEEQQRLIQTGLITPFGSSIEPCSSGGGGHSSLTPLGSESRGKLRQDNLVDEGLISGSCDDVGTTRVLRKARIPKITKKTASGTDDESGSAATTTPHSSALEPADEDFDESGWMPSLEDLLEDDDDSPLSGESEYSTDEELGGKKKKKMKLRELSSDGLSDEEEEDARPSKGKTRRRTKRKGKKRGNRLAYNDDGDEECYRQRIR